MTTAWGVPDLRDTDGKIIDATTPDDVQIITDAQYQNPGILTGAKIFTRADMKVNVTNGAVVMKWGQDRSVLVPVYEQTITLDPAPATGSTTVSFYVQQANTSTSRAASVVMTTGAVPAGAVVLDKLRVPAGATKSSAAESVWDRQYAMHSQSTLGTLSRAYDVGGDLRVKGKQYKKMQQRFTVDTDREVVIKLSITASREIYTPINETWGSLMYKIYLDDQMVQSYEVAICRFWMTQQLETYQKVKMGAHTVHVVSEWQSDGANPKNTEWRVRYGGAEKWAGDRLVVVDGGVAV